MWSTSSLVPTLMSSHPQQQQQQQQVQQQQQEQQQRQQQQQPFTTAVPTSLWPTAIPGAPQFPNVAQVNQMWMAALMAANNQNTLPSQLPMQATVAMSPIVLSSPSSSSPPAAAAAQPQQPQLMQSASASAPRIPTPIDTDSPSTFVTTLDELKEETQAQEEQKGAERKRRNREFSRRNREKRKNQRQQLESELQALAFENTRLKNLVHTHIPSKAQQIIQDCCMDHPLHYATNARAATTTTTSSSSHSLSNVEQQQDLIPSDFALIENLIKGRQSFVLTDPAQADNPIVYASPAFCELTGYTKTQVIGKNCRFLQGEETDPEAVETIRKFIVQGRDTSVDLLNYKADGSPFWNQFFLAPLRNREKKIVNYVGVQCEISEPKKELDDGTAVVNNAKIDKAKCIRIQAPPGIGSTMDNLTPLISEYHREPKNNGTQRKVQFDFDQGTIHRNVQNNYVDVDPLMEMAMAQPVEPTTIRSVASSTSSSTTKNFDSNTTSGNANNDVDWSELAEALEEEFQEMEDEAFDWDLEESFSKGKSLISTDDRTTITNSTSSTGESDDHQHQHNWDDYEQDEEPFLRSFTKSPFSFIKRTCRSELMDSLLMAQGDVKDERFLKALDVLSSIYASYRHSEQPQLDKNDAIDKFLNGSWVSLSRPAYSGCLGKNDRGDFMYTLGKMSFNMFKPTQLICSVQYTLNHIRSVYKKDEAPTAVPWSLRRELAMFDPKNTDEQQSAMNTGSKLRSYDIVIGLTIEPENKDQSAESLGETAGPSSRLRAIQLVQGYMLKDPDPNNPDRLSVWFTGGKLFPVAPPEPDENSPIEPQNSHYGGFDEWKRIFGEATSSSWSESFKNMGAKLFLGAELSSGMGADGSMAYTLHRPYGGHGKSFVEILYIDDDIYITRGNYGTIHVGVRSSLLSPTPAPANSQNAKSTRTPLSGGTSQPATVALKNVSIVPEEDDTVSFLPDDVVTLGGKKRKTLSDQHAEVPAMNWKDCLQTDLHERGPDLVTQELNEILISHGLQVLPTTKRSKLN